MRAPARAIPCLLAAALAAALLAPPGRAAELRVVASIKPVEALAAGVMAGAGKPTLLVRGGASPHTYSLRPSDVAALAEADVVFWVGELVEPFLQRPLAAAGARAVRLSELPGLQLLPVRAGGVWEEHAHDEEGEHAHGEDGEDHHGHDEHAAPHDEAHDHAALDLHIWLDPKNAEVMVAAMAEALAAADPANADLYRANARGLTERLAALDAELARTLAPVRDRPFIVFHDAFQYFEARYGLNAIGSITLSPERSPGARRLAAVRDRIAAAAGVCVFTEPQFPPRLLRTVTEGTAARTAELDPLGLALPEGAEGYFALLRNLAGAIRSCLAGGG